MSRSTAEVLLGPGYFYFAPYGEAFPTFAVPDTVDTLPGGNWVDAGYSEDGWNLVADLTYEYFTPAEEIDPIATIKMAQEVHFRGIAAQFSLENLQFALGGGSIAADAGPPATQTYTPPASDEYDFNAVLFRTKAPGTGKVRDIQIPRLISVSSLDIPHTKGASPSSVAIDVRALKESGVDVFSIYEMT
jgi:hypothetical protein